MATILEKGINIIINRKIGDINKPIYPFTKTANVIDENGNITNKKLKNLAKYCFVRFFYFKQLKKDIL